jgi:subtilisin family serine protease
MMISRVFPDKNGVQLLSNLLQGIEWCADNGARVINMSFGSGDSSVSEGDLISQLYSEGILVVAAAGNDGDSTLSYPASYPEVVSVASITESLQPSYFSQYNSEVDVCAPGSNILSTAPVFGIFDTYNVGAGGYGAAVMQGSPGLGSVSGGELVTCGLGFNVCSGAWGKICLIERGTTTFSEKAQNCKSGGGIAALIYNSAGNSDVIYGDVGTTPVITIPVLGIARSAGLKLLSISSVKFEMMAGYILLDGTSMAAPHVTGVAAKIWAARPECTNVQIREAIEQTARDLGDSGRDDLYGHGLVQAEDAYTYLLDLPPPCGVIDTTADPSAPPTNTPTRSPTSRPTVSPTIQPSNEPTVTPTTTPSVTSTIAPTSTPTFEPSGGPSGLQSAPPSIIPSSTPSDYPTANPSVSNMPVDGEGTTNMPVDDQTSDATTATSTNVLPSVLPLLILWNL